MRKLQNPVYAVTIRDDDGTYAFGVFGTQTDAQEVAAEEAQYRNREWSAKYEQLSDDLWFDPTMSYEIYVCETPMFR